MSVKLAMRVTDPGATNMRHTQRCSHRLQHCKLITLQRRKRTRCRLRIFRLRRRLELRRAFMHAEPAQALTKIRIHACLIVSLEQKICSVDQVRRTLEQQLVIEHAGIDVTIGADGIARNFAGPHPL